ncbi:MAG: DUF4954 family protein, partial [Spirochaetaceae bacterium]|nr:DUF4954 family protein [Spirochaetaceae bacterium]
MNTIFTRTLDGLGYHFIAGDYLPPGRDEYYLRDTQLKRLLGRTPESYRRLSDSEIEALVQNGNHSANWDDVFVSDTFYPALVQNSFFAGRVRIGNMESGTLKYHDYVQRTGIHNSVLISCDVGDNAAINNCPYISHYIIGNGVILSNVLELDTTNHSKFGEGIVKEGESEDVRV